MTGKLPALLLVGFGVCGCATQGEYVKEEQVAELQASITTAQQLEETLGIPSVTIPRNDGTVMWVYEGIYVRAGATQYIPYLSVLIGTNAKNCTRLSVLVDRETGELSDWDYKTEKDVDHWAKTDDKCAK